MFAKIFLVMALSLSTCMAQAHVKWFSSIADCAAKPLHPIEVIPTTLFISYFFLALAVMFVVNLTDSWLTRHQRFMEKLHCYSAPFAATILRFGLGLYLIACALYFYPSPIILTPELRSTHSWIPFAQCVFAAALFRRSTQAFGACGIFFLYLYAMQYYGPFHMLDYLMFPGAASYLLMESKNNATRQASALGILRAAMGFSLLWVSVEKWLYPNWAYAILQFNLHQLLMNTTPRFFVMGAGFVEFCLAFVLLYGRLSSQVAATFLMILMLLAIPLVGAIDAIGHLPIIAILLVLSLTQNQHQGRQHSAWMSAGYCSLHFTLCIAATMGAYFLSNQINYYRSNFLLSTQDLTALLLTLPLVLRMRLVEQAGKRAHNR
jgi:hypothetical protein